MARIFLFDIFLSESRRIFASRLFFQVLYNLHEIIFTDSTFLSCSFCFRILLKNCFLSFVSGCWFVLVRSPPICCSNLLWFCLNYMTLPRYLFRLLSLTIIFWFISFSFIETNLFAVVLLESFLSLGFCMLHLSKWFRFLSHSLIYLSCLISHQSFVFLLEFLREITILSMSNFVLA